MHPNSTRPDSKMLPSSNKQHTLIQIVDAALADATLRSGPHLVCKPGCSQCCIGVFPIAHEDAARLREGLSLLEKEDPAKAARIHARVKDSLIRLDPRVPRRPHYRHPQRGLRSRHSLRRVR